MGLVANHALWAIGLAVLVFVVPAVFFVPWRKFGGIHMSLISQMKGSTAPDKPSKGTGYATGAAKVVKLHADGDIAGGVLHVVLYRGEVAAITFGGTDRGLPFEVEKITNQDRFKWWQKFYLAGRQGSIRRIEQITTES